MNSRFSSYFSGIRLRLTISFIALAIGPLLLISFVLSYTSYRHEKQQSLAFQREKAHRIAVQVNGFFEKSIDRLTDIIRVRGLQGLGSNEIDSILSELVHYESFFEDVSLINSKGLEINKQHRIKLIQKNNLTDRENDPVYTIPKKEKRVYIGPIYFDESTGDPLMDLSIPILNPRDGSFNGILEGSVRFRKIWNLIIANSSDQSEEIYILNSEGSVVAHKNPSVVLRSTTVGKPYTSGVRKGLSGDQVVFTSERIEMGNLVLWVVIEKAFSTAIQGAINAIFIIILVTIISLTIAVLLAVPVAGNIVKPIQQLAKSSKSIIAGDFTTKVPIKGKGEIAELSLVFNEMTGQLHRSIEELKEEVNVRKAAEWALQISEERYRQLAENINEAFWIVSPDWQKVLYISPAYEKIWGKTTDSLYKEPLSWLNTILDDDKEKVARYIENINDELLEFIFPEYRILRPDGTIRWVFAKGFPVKAADGSLSRIVGVAEDITERKESEEKLEKNQYYLTKAQEIGVIGTWELDLKKNILIWTDENYKIFGVPLGTPLTYEIFLNCIHPEDKEYVHKKWTAALNKEPYDIEHRLIVDDKVKWVREKADVEFDEHGNPTIAIGFTQDITNFKHAEEQLKSNLIEKETLLHEIHHRVKNNMQVISSLLKLQANSIADDHIKDVLKESQSRVYAMSAVHEILHGSDNLSEIDSKSYLSKITTAIFQTYSTDNRKVEFKSNIEDTSININQASPLGLVANELISNSLKYAFPDERKGIITANLKKLDNELELVVMDDGVGMPEGFDWKKSNTLGLKLVSTLVENQLGGSIDMEGKNGTKFTIKFNIA
ncbi:PAS domain-containing protein [bacterium]|nr:PAS domain-containing protein [bacterium]